MVISSNPHLSANKQEEDGYLHEVSDKMLRAIDKNDAARMLDGNCKIRLQETEELLGPEKTQNSQMCIEFNDLCYSIRRNHREAEKTILYNVTGHFEPGKVTMIIGPSGAGKTTLLKIISGKQLIDVKGTITVNGVEWNRGIRKQMSYVSQQFDLLPFLTTRETLYIAARLKLDINQSKQAIYLVVNDIAESLNLLNCLDTLANNLSGGERKRLSIGVEMTAKSSVLLLDEPTSGLDSAASFQLVNMLHDIARKNCTVVCAIHQPSSQMISLFDDIMVLERGRCMYCGPKSEILNTYNIAGFTCPSFYNIAEFVLEVITEQRGGDLKNLHKICRDKYEEFKLRSTHNKNEPDTSTNSKQKFETNGSITPINNVIQKKSTWQQQKILFLRALICIKRDNILTKLRLGTHIVIALLIGILFYNFGDDAEKVNGNISCLFTLLFFLYLANAILAVLMFPTEAAVFIQEHLNNWYSLRSYYSVKVLTDLLMQILCASSFTFISYYMTGQPMECDRILQSWSVCMLITIFGQTIGIFTGTIIGVELGVFLIPAISIPFVLFAGFFIRMKEMSVYLRPLSTMSFFRYAFEGLMQAVYLDRPNLQCFEIYCYMQSPKKILSIMDIPTVPFYVTVIILGCWILCFHIITYAVLRWKIYYARK